MRKIVYILFSLFFMMSGNDRLQLMAQEAKKMVIGSVVEMFADQEEPLVGVNVTVVNEQDRTIAGAITDVYGNYALTLPHGETQKLTLVFSYIGMQTQRIAYKGQSTQNVVMESSARQIKEVEISTLRVERNDMGITQREMVSATQKIQMDDLVSTVPVSTVEEALQGQLAGVDITVGGDPGSKSSIRIRGMNTLSGSAEPLFVIDGVPQATDISDDFDFQNADEEDLGALLSISPSDIESVEVLKDASATAIWGAKGANGVIIINTKKGAVGPTRFNYSFKFTNKFEPNRIPMLNGDQYTALMQDEIWNAAQYVGVSNASSYLSLLFNTPAIGYDPSWVYFDEYNCDTKWLDEVRSNAWTVEHNISMSGGGEKATYRFSLGYLNEGGTTIGTAMDRLNTSARLDYNFSKRLKFGANFSFSQIDKDANWATTIRSEALSKMPNKSPYVLDENGESTGDYFTYQASGWENTFNGSSNYNPTAMAKEAFNNTIQRSSKMTLDTRYTILPGLTFSGYASIGIGASKNFKFLPQSVTGVPWTSKYANQSYDGSSESLSIQTEMKLNYQKSWQEGTHALIANLLYRTSQSSSTKYASTTSGLAAGSMSDPTVSSSVTSASSGKSEGRSLEGVFLANYTLLGRYSLQGSISMEGNSAFGKRERIGYFPGFGFSWNIQEEPWMESARDSWVDVLKIRLGIGQSGKAPKGNSIYMGAFAAGDPYMSMSSIYPTRIQLNNLKWETSTEYNAGFELYVLNNRLKLIADAYIKNTDDLLRQKVSIPSTTGFSTINYFNSGELQNKGIEARIDYEIFRNKSWTISASINAARNRSEILELPINMSEEEGAADSDADMSNGKYAARAVEGQPVGAFYGYRYKGVYSTTQDTYARDVHGNVMRDMNGMPVIMKNGIYTCYAGDAMYEDINHDGVINKYDIVYLGNSQPVLTGGANLNVRYKQWSMRVSFHGRFGQYIVNKARMNNEAMYGKSNQSTAVLRRWRIEGDLTDIPRALYANGLNYLGSDRFVEKASYLRLKTLTLSYAMPSKIAKSLKMKSLSSYITAYNLYTWTNYSGQDPEVTTPGSAFSLAEDNASTPAAIRISIGLNASF